MIPDVTFHRSVFSFQDIPNCGLPEICISGRSNVGKSSMLNCLTKKRNLARISQTPGKTRSLNYYLVDKKFFLVDLPGYGYAKISKSQKIHLSNLADSYLSINTKGIRQKGEGRRVNAKNTKTQILKGLIQLFDARHGPISGDKVMLEWIREWGGNTLFVLTKADKLSTSNKKKLERTYKKEFGLENMVMFSAHTGSGTKDIWSWIYNTLK